MNIYPAIDIRKGQTVQLVGGDPGHVGVQGGNPTGQAQKWFNAGAKRLHVVDLDAAFGDKKQWHLLSGILGVGLPVQFGGGVRSMTDVQQLLNLGVKRVIVGTQAIKNPAWLKELTILFPGKVILAVDARGRDVAAEGWTETTGKDVMDVVAEAAAHDVAGFLYTNIEKEGRMQGIDLGIVKDLRVAAGGHELIVSGGITTDEDLKQLQDAGVDGVVLGMALYKEAFDIKDLVSRYEVSP